MTVSKLAPVAAAALALLAFASQANAAPAHHARGYENSYASSFDSTYRDPTTREALDEGAW